MTKAGICPAACYRTGWCSNCEGNSDVGHETFPGCSCPCHHDSVQRNQDQGEREYEEAAYRSITQEHMNHDMGSVIGLCEVEDYCLVCASSVFEFAEATSHYVHYDCVACVPDGANYTERLIRNERLKEAGQVRVSCILCKRPRWGHEIKKGALK